MAFIHDPQTKDLSEGVRLRHQVSLTIANDIKAAYELAKSIKHNWYRCQALANVAEHSSATFMKRILLESFDSAMKCHDQNRRVSVARWPLAAAIKSDLNDLASSFLMQCMGQINQEMDPISKWCAADIVHTIKSNPNLLQSFYPTFVSATSQGHGWRVERYIRDMLSDIQLQKHDNYISYLLNRQKEIQRWKVKNLNKSVEK